jgi:hypothetical protein
MQIRIVEAALKYADRLTGKTEVTGAFCDHGNAPKMCVYGASLACSKVVCRQKISTHGPLLVAKVTKNNG